MAAASDPRPTLFKSDDFVYDMENDWLGSENGDLESILLSEEREHPEIRKWSCRLKMSLEIAKGMDFLHSLNPSIIHRDLKTANVLVDCTYHCKIIQFVLSTMRGISRRSAVQSSSSPTVMGTVTEGTRNKENQSKSS
ncbi:receptor-interacting serine/threonine-protein kinase 2-like [Corticium candelabrum]|uniref:receptor-interacting serine/threonine-protein kinase 2-like n=1 Tax=Corticium candelabrum TaxID=121492 RepID=UPI002E2EBC99|nr:receptor-interacting serine/threonine-protein kinase 2-like [Corticium candelabrum]